MNSRENLHKKSANSSIPLPVFQAWLIVAGWITQLLTWSIPKHTPLNQLARNFNSSTWINPIFSDNTLDLIREFKEWVILASHDNWNMSDFSWFLSEINDDTATKLRIWTGKTVTPMYGKLIPNTEVFLAEWNSQTVFQWIDETISSVNSQTRVALLPYFWKLQGVHKRILNGIKTDTPILRVETRFPFAISYAKGKDWWMWEDTIYWRIIRWYDSIDVNVSAKLDTPWSYNL